MPRADSVPCLHDVADPSGRAGDDVWELPIVLPEGRYRVHVVEPGDTPVTPLLQKIRAGRYPRPYVLDDGDARHLHFGFKFVQSRMAIDVPEQLSLRYTRAMMAFLLFRPTPRRVAIIGLGGGSLTKFCHKRLPRTHVTSIEIDPAVIALSALFDVPPAGPRLQVVQADAAAWFAADQPPVDVVLHDGCDAQGLAPALCNADFFAALRASLVPGGIAVVNLVGTVGRSDGAIRLLDDAFDGRVLVLPVSSEGNRIAFAFDGGDWPPDWVAVNRRIDELTQRFGLNFTVYARDLERSANAASRATRPPRLVAMTRRPSRRDP